MLHHFLLTLKASVTPSSSPSSMWLTFFMVPCWTLSAAKNCLTFRQRGKLETPLGAGSSLGLSLEFQGYFIGTCNGIIKRFHEIWWKFSWKPWWDLMGFHANIVIWRRFNGLFHDAWDTLLIPGILGNQSTIRGYQHWCMVTRPGKRTKNYGTSPFIVDFPMKNGDVPWFFVSLPEGNGWNSMETPA